MVDLFNLIMDQMAAFPVGRNCPFRRRKPFLHASRRHERGVLPTGNLKGQKPSPDAGKAPRQAACEAAAGCEPAPLGSSYLQRMEQVVHVSTPFGRLTLGLVQSEPLPEGTRSLPQDPIDFPLASL